MMVTHTMERKNKYKRMKGMMKLTVIMKINKVRLFHVMQSRISKEYIPPKGFFINHKVV